MGAGWPMTDCFVHHFVHGPGATSVGGHVSSVGMASLLKTHMIVGHVNVR
jgi:hypothetical protein